MFANPDACGVRGAGGNREIATDGIGSVGAALEGRLLFCPVFRRYSKSVSVSFHLLLI